MIRFQVDFILPRITSWWYVTRCKITWSLRQFESPDSVSTLQKHQVMVQFTEPGGVRERPQKKIRTSEKPRTKQKSSSDTRLFAPFRALGLVTNHVPFYLQTRSHKGATEGPRIHLLTCLGRSWALWEGGKMTLLFVGG